MEQWRNFIIVLLLFFFFFIFVFDMNFSLMKTIKVL